MNNRIGLIHIYRDQKLGDYRKVIFVDRILSVDKGDQVPFFSSRRRFKDRCSPWGASRRSIDRGWKKKMLRLPISRNFVLSFLSPFSFIPSFIRLFNHRRFAPWSRNCRETL